MLHELLVFLGTPWLLGISISLAANRGRQSLGLIHTSVVGYFIGFLSLATLLWVLSAWHIEITLAKTVLISTSISIILISYSILKTKPHLVLKFAPSYCPISTSLIFLLMCYLCTLAYFAVLKPTYSWDAIGHWAYQAKFWYEAGEVSPEAFKVGTPSPLISLIIYWGILCSANSESTLWHSAWAFIPAVSLMALSVKEINSPIRKRAIITVALLLACTPLITTHTLLAGYADLWLAYAILAFNIQLLIYIQSKSAGGLIVALILAIFCVLIKKSGTIYLAICLLHWFAYFCISFMRASTQLSLVKAYLTSILAIPIFISIFSTMEFDLTDTTLSIANFPGVKLEINNSVPYFVESLFTSLNWSLGFYLFLPAFYYRFLRSGAAPLRGIDILPMASLGMATFLLALTSSTDLYFEWSKNGTSLNRLIMSLFPLFCIGSLLALFRQSENNKFD